MENIIKLVKKFMVNIALAVFAIFLYSANQAQDASNQALIKEYSTIAADETLHDTVRINALMQWDDLIYYEFPDLDQELNEKAIKIAKKALSKANLSSVEKLFYYERLRFSYNVVGINLDTKGYYLEALNNYYEAIKYAQLLEDREREGAISNNIGLVHELQGNNEKAEEFYLVAEEIALEFNDTTGIISSKNNLGSLYSKLEKFEISKVKYEEAIAYAEKANYRGQLASSYQNLGVLFELQDQYEVALKFYRKCLKICEEDQIYWEEHAKVLYNIGAIYYQQNETKVDSAIYFCRTALDIASEFNSRYTMLNCENCLYKSYKKKGNIDSAFRHLEVTLELEDSIRSKENTILIAQKESEFKYQQKSVADSIHKAEEKKITDAIIAKETAEKEKQTQRTYYLAAGLALVALFGFFVYSRLQITKRQKETISKQKKESDLQKEVIAEQHQEITDSINYAEMIQESVLPALTIEDVHQNSFVIFNPKEKVSGDFFWLEKDENRKYFCVADCTGHGIPGAFISMIGTILLNEIYNSKRLRLPNEILDELNKLVRLTLTNKDGVTMKDGMDLALVILDTEKNKLFYSGANNPLWILRQSDLLTNSQKENRSTVIGKEYSLIEIKATKQPIGMYNGDPKPFELVEIDLQPNDSFYIFSDGYADQFGGPAGKKFKYKPLKKLLLNNYKLSMSEQRQELIQIFNNWKGNLEQVDDVCMIGVKV